MVTFLFTDIEGSTKLLDQLGAVGYSSALLEHRRLLREAFVRHGGVEVDTQGDAFFVAFPTASGALAAAGEFQAALVSGPIRVRVGIHTGTPHLGAEGYVGADVHKGARIAAAAHGGQVALSGETRVLLGEVFPFTDLGEHQLKDFTMPVSIFQLGEKRFPPLRTVSNTNLPRPASSFVGRRREVREVAALLTDGERFLTLTGPGGSGKTRLSIEAAGELVPEFKAGVFWVGLATLTDPTLVAETIAQTLGVKGGLAAHIGEREMLLVLDNLEQVVEAAHDLAALVEACPNLRLITTSRERLRVRGELEYPVLPLAEPEAVDLFCARAQLAPDATIAELCRRLDSLPLALELAAVRTSVLSPKQILERLSKRLDLLTGGRDVDPRQQTLRATIEWSYHLLSPEEKATFARLAVFRSGWALVAAEEITEADLDTLQSLVDKSLVRHAGERFWMLETIGEYAAERFEASGDAQLLRRRHAEHFLALAEEAYPQIAGDPKEWFDRLQAELDNFRAALDWLQGAGETQPALQLAGALWRFWMQRGHLSEGRRRLEALIRLDHRPTAARARALNGATALMVTGGDLATARLWAEEALVLHRRLGNAWGTAYSVFTLGLVATEEADWKTAGPIFEESVRAFRELGDDHYTLVATDGLAWTYGALGDQERRRALHEDVLRQARAQADEGVVAAELAQLARFARDEGRIADALSMLSESLGITHHLERPDLMVEGLCRFASTLSVAGHAETATRLLSCAEVLRGEIGGSFLWVLELNEETLREIHANLDEAAFAEAWERGRTMIIDEAVALAVAYRDPRSVRRRA